MSCYPYNADCFIFNFKNWSKRNVAVYLFTVMKQGK